MNLPPRRVALRRGSKEVLESNTEILRKYQIIVELPEQLVGVDREDLMGKKCKYKIGDGEHTYKELPYEDQTIPVAFYV